MPSAYDRLLGDIGDQQQPVAPRAYQNLIPPTPQETPEIGYTRDRWQGVKPPSLSGSLQAFGQELRAQLENFDRGLRQLFVASPLQEDETREQLQTQLATEQQAADSEMAGVRKEHPIASGLGYGAPYAAMPQRALPAMLGGALWEGLKYGTTGERAGAAAGGAVNSLLGNVLGNMGRFAIQPTPRNPATLGFQGAAQRLGAPLTAGQRSLDPRTLQFEDYLRQTPFGSIPLQRVGNEQATAVNRAAAKSIGEQADNLTSDVLESAKQRISSYYDDLTSRNTLTVDKTLIGEKNALLATLKTDVEPGTEKVIKAQIDKITEKLKANNGSLPGEVFQSLQSDLKKIAAGGDEKAFWAKQLLDMMRRGMERSLTPADKAKWALANEQYRNFKRITDKAFAVNSVSGQVNPKAVARQLESEGDRFARGQLNGPMADVGYFGRGIPSTAVGSQTAPRYFWNQMRSDPVGGLLGGIPDYLAASILARGGAFTAAPWLQGPTSAALGYLGRGGAPGMVQGWLNQ